MGTNGYRLRDGDQPLPNPGHVDVARQVIESLKDSDLLQMVGYVSPGIEIAVSANIVSALDLAAEIAADINRRIDLGIQRYGHRLETNNGRDALRDEYEELLDAANYAMQDWLQSSEFVALRRYRMIMALAFSVKAAMRKRAAESRLRDAQQVEL